MKRSFLIRSIFFTLAICLIPAAGFCEDTNITKKTDITIQHSVDGVADEVNQMKDFDFELQQRERDRMKKWNIEDSNEAVKVGDTYYETGELDDAIAFYRIAIKINPANTAAHEKYISARQEEKGKVSTHYHRAMEYYRKGMKDKAIDELVAELKENPDNDEARVKLNEIESE